LGRRSVGRRPAELAEADGQGVSEAQTAIGNGSQSSVTACAGRPLEQGL
jgi:hypothetical protein